MKISSIRPQKAFSLAEVCLALGLAAFCLVAMVGLLPAGLQNTRVSAEQTTATSLLSSIIADLRSVPTGGLTSSRLGIALPPSGSATSTVYLNESGEPVAGSATARYAVTAELNNATAAMPATRARILVFWPASAPAANAQGSVEVVTAWNRN